MTPFAGMTSTEALAASLFDLVQAPIRWQVLATLLELDAFPHLGTPMSAASLLRRTGQDGVPEHMALLLDAAVGQDLLVKATPPEGEVTYVLTEDAFALLHPDGDCCMVPTLCHLSQVRHFGIGGLTALLVSPGSQAGGPATAVKSPLSTAPTGGGMTDPAFWVRAQKSLRGFHRALQSRTALAVLQSLPDWPTVGRFLDLGAGSLELGTRIAAIRPDMDVTLMDLPAAAAALSASQFSEPSSGPDSACRLRILPGDYNDPAFDAGGGGYDMVWAAMCLYFARDLTAVLCRLKQALRPGGLFVSLHEGLSPDRTAPEHHVTGRLVPTLRGGVSSFTQGEILRHLTAAGFTDGQSRSIETPFGTMDLVTARA